MVQSWLNYIAICVEVKSRDLKGNRLGAAVKGVLCRGGDLVIQDCFGVRHVAKLSGWQLCWQAGNSGKLEFNTDVFCTNHRRLGCRSNWHGPSNRSRYRRTLPQSGRDSLSGRGPSDDQFSDSDTVVLINEATPESWSERHCQGTGSPGCRSRANIRTPEL